MVCLLIQRCCCYSVCPAEGAEGSIEDLCLAIRDHSGKIIFGFMSKVLTVPPRSAAATLTLDQRVHEQKLVFHMNLDQSRIGKNIFENLNLTLKITFFTTRGD